MSNAKHIGYITGRFGPEGREVASEMGILPKPLASKKPLVDVKPIFDEDDKNLPWVTCLCITYGRFSLLKRAIACFLVQDFPKKKLLIINDAPVALNTQCLPENITVVNTKKRFKTTGDKRQFALKQADTEYVANWDDDDIYFPWHILSCSRVLNMYNKMNGVILVRPNKSWLRIYANDEYNYALNKGGACGAVQFYLRKQAIESGGFDSLCIGEDIAFDKKIQNMSKLAIFDPGNLVTHMYDRDRLGKITETPTKSQVEAYERFAINNTDFGDFRLLVDEFDTPVDWAKNFLSENWLDFLDNLQDSTTVVDVEIVRSMFVISTK